MDPLYMRLTFPNAEAPAQMWVKLNCFCVAKISGVNSSVEKDSGSFGQVEESELQSENDSKRCHF